MDSNGDGNPQRFSGCRYHVQLGSQSVDRPSWFERVCVWVCVCMITSFLDSRCWLCLLTATGPHVWVVAVRKDGDETDEHRTSFCLRCIRMLEDATVSGKTAVALCDSLITAVDGLSTTAVVNLCQHFLELLQDKQLHSGRSLDIFPKLLAALGAIDQLPQQEGLSGATFRHQVRPALSD